MRDYSPTFAPIMMNRDGGILLPERRIPMRPKMDRPLLICWLFIVEMVVISVAILIFAPDIQGKSLGILGLILATVMANQIVGSS
jgi:hypothetical protein